MDAAVLLAACTVLAGCGYALRADRGPQGVRTVAIDVVANNTYRQRVEVPLTREIYRTLPTHMGITPASKDTADAVLTVEIEQIQGLSLVQGGADPVREGALQWHVHVVLTDRRTGEVLVDQRIVDRSEFRTPVGENTDTAVRESAMDLGRKIALALEPGF